LGASGTFFGLPTLPRSLLRLVFGLVSMLFLRISTQHCWPHPIRVILATFTPAQTKRLLRDFNALAMG
jgi:hypothetical protein